MNRKKAVKSKKGKSTRTRKIDIDQNLLQTRQLFLCGTIDTNTTRLLIKQMIGLDGMSHKPILLYINSGGGSVTEGFAIIDVIKTIPSPVVTIICGRACSMAGLVALAGRQRLMTKNSVWMSHDLSSGAIDYATKFLDRAGYIKELQTMLFDYLKDNTKLTPKELKKAKNGELWLSAKECKERDIVQYVIGSPIKRLDKINGKKAKKKNPKSNK